MAERKDSVMFDPKVIRTLALISQVGISMMVPIFLMAWLGVWIDNKLSTQLLKTCLYSLISNT